MGPPSYSGPSLTETSLSGAYRYSLHQDSGRGADHTLSRSTSWSTCTNFRRKKTLIYRNVSHSTELRVVPFESVYVCMYVCMYVSVQQFVNMGRTVVCNFILKLFFYKKSLYTRCVTDL